MPSALNETSPDNIALIDGDTHYTYGDLARRIERLAGGLLAGATDLKEARVAFLVPASVDYVTALHGVWRAGGIAIPLNVASTESEWEHCLTNTGVAQLLTTEANRNSIESLCDRLSIPLALVDEVATDTPVKLPDLVPERRAMIVFTSGTTSKPKGAVTTHANIAAQINTLIEAWAWQSDDVIPLFLPLHHVHGIINVLSCALWAGATVHVMPKLDLGRLCAQVADDVFSVFMAVPTIYVKLIDYLETLEDKQATLICEGFANMRLNVSGSAACPIEVFEDWCRLTGQALLERYGMSETIINTSNPLVGDRVPGTVGFPLPNQEVRVADAEGVEVPRGDVGTIEVRGPNVFSGYWQQPDKTAQEIRPDGFFITGDLGTQEPDGRVAIVGRAKDLVISGGYNVYPKEVERLLDEMPDIVESAVIGVPHDDFGEAVVAVLVAAKQLDVDALNSALADQLARFKQPKAVIYVDELPRNTMGKVQKNVLRDQYKDLFVDA